MTVLGPCAGCLHDCAGLLFYDSRRRHAPGDNRLTEVTSSTVCPPSLLRQDRVRNETLAYRRFTKCEYSDRAQALGSRSVDFRFELVQTADVADEIKRN